MLEDEPAEMTARSLIVRFLMLYLRQSFTHANPIFLVSLTAPRLPRTSVLYALARRDSDTPDLPSTVSFLDSCAKEETSPTTMVPVESQSTATSLPMRTFS
mmetsp:Transcript_13899/g.33612  ORF Transcript_13899/g.33612 Transcript_13899/m.33612 type:complete len:101 (-) Transcript_13899:431-733(-)